MINIKKTFFALTLVCSYAFAAQNQDGAFPLITADALHALANETENQQAEAKERVAETPIATEVQTNFVDEMLSLSTIDSSTREALMKKHSLSVQNSFLSFLKDGKESELFDQAYDKGNSTQQEAIIVFLDHCTKGNNISRQGFQKWYRQRISL